MSTFAVNDEAEKKQPSKLASLAARLVAKNEQDNLNEVEQVGKTNYRDDNRDSGDDESDDDGFGAYDSIDNEEDEEEEGEGDLGDAQMNMIERLVAARGSADAGTAAKITELLNSMGINWGGAERVKRTDVFGEVRMEEEVPGDAQCVLYQPPLPPHPRFRPSGQYSVHREPRREAKVGEVQEDRRPHWGWGQRRCGNS
jgi:hypothetical protein